MLWKCQDWESIVSWSQTLTRVWLRETRESMAKILDLERQWSQALKSTLRALVDHNEPSEVRGKTLSVTENYLE